MGILVETGCLCVPTFEAASRKLHPQPFAQRALFFPQTHSFLSCSMLSCSPLGDTIATPRMQGVYIEDAEEGGLNVSADGWQPSSPPSPATPSPQLQIFTDWLRSHSVEIPPSKSLGLNHYKDGDVGVGVFPKRDSPFRRGHSSGSRSMRFKVERVDFLRADVAHEEGGAVRGEATPRNPRSDHPAKAFEARHPLHFSVRKSHAIDCRLGAVPGVEINVLTVGGPLREANAGLRQFRPLLCGEVEQHEFLTVQGSGHYIVSVRRKSGPEQGFGLRKSRYLQTVQLHRTDAGAVRGAGEVTEKDGTAIGRPAQPPGVELCHRQFTGNSSIRRHHTDLLVFSRCYVDKSDLAAVRRPSGQHGKDRR